MKIRSVGKGNEKREIKYMKSIKGPRMQHESMKRYEHAYNVLGLGGPFLVAATGRSVIT